MNKVLDLRRNPLLPDHHLPRLRRSATAQAHKPTYYHHHRTTTATSCTSSIATTISRPYSWVVRRAGWKRHASPWWMSVLSQLYHQHLSASFSLLPSPCLPPLVAAHEPWHLSSVVARVGRLGDLAKKGACCACARGKGRQQSSTRRRGKGRGEFGQAETSFRYINNSQLSLVQRLSFISVCGARCDQRHPRDTSRQTKEEPCGKDEEI